MRLPSAMMWNCSQICPSSKFKKSPLLSGDLDFISWNPGDYLNNTCPAHVMACSHLQSSWVPCSSTFSGWVTKSVGRVKLSLVPAMTGDSKLWTLHTSQKSRSPPRCATHTPETPLTLLRTEGTWWERGHQRACSGLSRSKGWVSTGAKAAPALGGTTSMLAHLGFHSPAS